MALRNLDRYLYVQKMAFGGKALLEALESLIKVGKKSRGEYKGKLVRSAQKLKTPAEQEALFKRIKKEADALLANNHRGELDPTGKKVIRNRNYEKQLYPAVVKNDANANVSDLNKQNTSKVKQKTSNENPLMKEAETAQKEAAEATKETKTTAPKPAEKPAEKPKTDRPAVPDNAAPESTDTGLKGYNEYQPGETIKHGDKRLFDGKLKQFDENSGKWESIKDWERRNNPEAQSPQQQGVISRLRNWLIGPAAPAGSEVAWNPQGILRRYADLRPYVEGRPFLYNPWVSTTALWTLAGGNEGHKRGYSYPDSYSVGFQSSPLMKILGIASGLTGVGDTFEEMERNGVIQKVNRNGNRQVAAAPQNYLDWDSLTDMDMAYNPYGGYMDNISPDFLED